MAGSQREMELLRRKAEILAAAGHPIRLAIIEFLADGERCVCDIAGHVAAERSNVSRHLGVLLSAGVVSQRKEGLRMIYSLRTPCLLNFLSCATQVLREQLQEDSRLLKRI